MNAHKKEKNSQETIFTDMEKDNYHFIHAESFCTFSCGSILQPGINRGIVSGAANT